MNQKTSSYFECSLFEQSIKDYASFSYLQEEAKLLDRSDTSKFKIEKIEYKCCLSINKELETNKPLLLIPTKDNLELIEFTLKNLIKFKINEHANILVIDDRSSINHNEVCKKYEVNCMRVDNPKGFNFSSLINVGIKLAIDKNIEHVVMWNNDLWADSDTTFPILLKKHIDSGSTITGTKLVYPPFKWDGKDDRSDIKEMFGLNKTHRGTVQFGGSNMIFNNQLNNYMVGHRARFFEPLDPRCNTDRTEIFLTGAFQIINTSWLKDIKGLNPSLSKAYQDVDISFKAVKDKKKLSYFGENLYFFHDESLSQTDTKAKFDLQFLSDQVLMYKIWNRQEFEFHLLGMANE